MSRGHECMSHIPSTIGAARYPPPLNPSSLPQHRQRVYTCLRTQGWSPQQCDYYFANIPSGQRHIHLILRHVEGWDEEQLGRFDQRCAEEYLPKGAASGPGG
ncbi:hypothetical protein BJX65DRAFT_307257 [Aspergillus insuetus]